MTKSNSNEPIFRKIRSERLSEKVADQLRKAIGEGRFKVGEKLPSQPDLAELMGVSRPSIREAVKLLELQGMIESVQGGGTLVRNIAAQEIGTPIETLLVSDKEKVIELMDVRALLEVWSAKRAAHNRTEDELKQILTLTEEMEKDFASGSIRYELDAKFHKEIAGATHNTILTHIVGSVFDLIRESIRFHREEIFVSRNDQRKILEHHKKIYEAIRDSDPERSEVSMHEHLQFVIREYRRRFFND
ncbi:MAG: FadR/GntR family transcriptional regulator [Desulfomonilaceae bacterium]